MKLGLKSPSWHQISGARVSDFLLLGMWSNNFWSINVHQQGAELQSQDGPRQQNQNTLFLRI
jgi:outer membrane biogenesis lipoprotein LolB